MHFRENNKIGYERLEGNYLSLLGQYLCHKKYIDNGLPLSFVIFIFLLVIFLLQQLTSYCDHHPMIDSQQAI
jgi:hypothetical protein